ncbi:putative bifunctional diguanylate cyclase/phosphodiesterase [Nocardioides bizhenqiangii]|uniref:EAL domain-containing protein n=1 Tax=Nocardioides bizhenqiangii TaxID=3095076 RepID=A0ABZ0ZR35_9ACTN|nr:EAL domain-containing protein [Nocardioides sp. HM61]WQQ26376.1 EAL domain-containing protein [Nocardioides sp. HM61]
MQAEDAARFDHEGRLRLIIEAVPNAMIMVDGRGGIVLVNSEAERAFGYSRDELVSMRVEQLVPERYRRAHQGYRDSFFAAPDTRGMGVGRELFGLRKDGTEIPIELGLNPITIGDERFVLAAIIDITERLRGQAAADAAREDVLRRSILDTIPFSIIATDRRGRILTANPAAETLLGYRPEELIGSWLTKIDAEPRDRDADGSPMLAGAVGTEVEWTYRRKDGRLIPVNEVIVDLGGDDASPAGFLAIAYDITKRIEVRARVEFMANHDALTSLPNRAKLMRHLDRAIAKAAAEGTEVALLLLDLDHFKRVNDSLGHHVGDELLLQVAERLHSWIRRGDLIARLGGDEFVIVFGGVTARADLTARLDELHTALGPVVVHGYELLVTASTGGAVYPDDGSSASQLLKHADVAMYRAKAAGRNNAQWFEPAMLEESNDKLSLSAALRHAVVAGELSTVYQPLLDLETGRLLGFEALARWRSSDLGPISPERFIPVAEDSGLIRELGGWVLRQACADVAALQREIGRNLRLAVNVSPRQLRGTAWLDEVLAALDESGLEPDQLEVEITEGLLIDDHGDAVELLERIRRHGVKIVVDDFGRGYSSLAYLSRFPIDKIKIDKSFVQQIESVDASAAIVDAIIVMAHALGLTVVAEGVETTEQHRYLTARGCDEVQGYLYSHGLPRHEVAAAVRRLEASADVGVVAG